MNSQDKSILILSVGPVPVDEETIVEGGGLRAWGIAIGLMENGIQNITVAIPEGFGQLNTNTYKDIKLIRWNFDNLQDLLKDHTATYVLYSHADLMRYVSENIPADQQLIVDLYVPIYIEILARGEEPSVEKLMEYQGVLPYWNTAFPRGDYFLVANEKQYDFYSGVVSVFGRTNIFTYKRPLLHLLPYGIHNTPFKKSKNVFKGLKIKSNDFLILWFGGLYPWFDIYPLLQFMLKVKKEERIKLLILGGKNPFNPNPKIFEQYEFAVNLAKKKDLLDKNIFFHDWIPYEERIKWYKEADVVVNLHKPSMETRYAWRTRIVDYILGEVPLVTTYGDGIEKELSDKNAAILVKDNDPTQLSNLLFDLYRNPQKLEKLKSNIAKVKKQYYWKNLTKDLAQYIKSGLLAPDRAVLLERKLKNPSILPEGRFQVPPRGTKGNRILEKIKRIYNKEGINGVVKRGIKRLF